MTPEEMMVDLKARGHPVESDESGLAQVVAALGVAYRGDREAIDAFLNRPHPLLDGETPFEMTRSGSAGAEAVLNLIRRAQAGIAL